MLSAIRRIHKCHVLQMSMSCCTRLLWNSLLLKVSIRCVCATCDSAMFLSVRADPGAGEGHALPAGLSEVL